MFLFSNKIDFEVGYQAKTTTAAENIDKRAVRIHANYVFFYIIYPCSNGHDHRYGVLLHFVILPIRPEGSGVYMISV